MCMVKFWIYLGGGGGNHKTGLFLGVIYIYYFLRSRYRIGIFLEDWYFFKYFWVVTDSLLHPLSNIETPASAD